MTAAAVLCALVNSLNRSKGMAGAVLKLVTGIVMTSVVLNPFGSGIRLNLNTRFLELERQVNAAVAQGEETTKNEMAARIKTATEAYILDKAAQLGAAVQVRVILNGENLPVPVQVELEGEVSPSARMALTRLMREELGIPEEAQKWNSKFGQKS